ncbi:hypothetical protein DFH07DRAFT_973941 [Mycena maculata]|uniref:Uncharacterized protein n=1 Tax=Mycena maculata TaxID=230809 RepID=A0AAD7MHE4_9AGAR|nr:hypothetical protein DFH07DRAFT_973941 [Mycena maculata]
MSLRRVHIEELPEPHSQHRSPPLPDDGLIVLVLNEDYIPVTADSTMLVHLLFQEEQQANTNNPPLPGLPLHLLFHEEEEEGPDPVLAVPGPAQSTSGPSASSCYIHATSPVFSSTFR